ncbi:MAG: 3-oxoacyl-[acyl-carrier-protein] reductase [Planctomycetota bacterium]|jgi:3-oxoacyl-[acyl-carrier protein] reductase|nr:3-oxoacyl-[acyl-carrier-protein] reductase [Planctomycetota bacterium]
MRGKTAVITGGARGIGESIAKLLAKMGANIIIWDVLEDQARATADAIARNHGVKTLGAAADVTREASVEAALDAAVKEFGGIDILVNNAGVTRDGLLIRMKEEDWDLVLSINLKGVWICTKAVARVMLKARKGSIVNIASVVGVMGNAGQANYSASKAGVIGLTKTSAREFAARGVRVNAVAPGFIRTAMTDKLSDEQRGRLQSMIPLGELGTPDDVADAVAFLASDRARYITGQTINIDGGMVM